MLQHYIYGNCCSKMHAKVNAGGEMALKQLTINGQAVAPSSVHPRVKRYAVHIMHPLVYNHSPAIIQHSCQPARERGVKNVQFTIVLKIANNAGQGNTIISSERKNSTLSAITSDLFRREKGFKS